MKKFWGQIHKHQKVFPDLNVEEFQFKVIFLDPDRFQHKSSL